MRVGKLTKRIGKRTNQVNVRMSDAEREIMERIAEERGMEYSAVLRMALLEFNRNNPPRDSAGKRIAP